VGHSATADAAIVKLEIFLDRAGASPGVIDGFDGDNLRKAVRAFEAMAGLTVDGKVSSDLIGKLHTGEPVIGSYTIADKDVADLVPSIPSDYAEMAKLKFLGYVRIPKSSASGSIWTRPAEGSEPTGHVRIGREHRGRRSWS